MSWTPHDYGFNLEGGTTRGGRSQSGKLCRPRRENLMEEDEGDTDLEGSYIHLEEEHFT